MFDSRLTRRRLALGGISVIAAVVAVLSIATSVRAQSPVAVAAEWQSASIPCVTGEGNIIFEITNDTGRINVFTGRIDFSNNVTAVGCKIDADGTCAVPGGLYDVAVQVTLDPGEVATLMVRVDFGGGASNGEIVGWRAELSS